MNSNVSGSGEDDHDDEVKKISESQTKPGNQKKFENLKI